VGLPVDLDFLTRFSREHLSRPHDHTLSFSLHSDWRSTCIFLILGLANHWQAVTSAAFGAALSSIIPFFLLFISLDLF
jgi:hypothetical protein